jgi:two-component system, cell cycle sensor histidine kinase and response regulator CckA
MMVSRTRDPYRNVPGRALALSIAALTVPLLGTTVFGNALGEQEPLLWLLALVPGFLLAYYRGWRGASVALAAGMAALAMAHSLGLWLGRGLPDGPLLLGVTAAFVASALGAGWTSELLHRRFLLAQEHALDLTLIVDSGGMIRYASPSSRRILGLAPGSIVNQGLERLLEPGSDVPALRPHEDGASGDPLIQLRAVGADGSVHILEASVEDRRRDPRVAGLVVRARDVTERVRSEEQYRRLYRMQAITQLAGALAHDFNNVLTTIRGNVHLLQEELPAGINTERGFADILGATERASMFVDQLLAFTRQQTLHPRPVDLNALLGETEARLQEMVGPGARMVLDLEEDLPQVVIDPGELRRILVILAARAGEGLSEGGEFRLTTRREEITEGVAERYSYPVIPGEYAVLTITDTGPELSASARARIFEPFSVIVGEDATGLELSSIYGTVKQSGGYVWVESGGGAGTSFRIFLPLGTVLEEEPELARAEGGGGRGTVLIAEDDAHVRAVVSRVLLKEGYYILEAADGEEALHLAEHVGKRLDLVVADMSMPSMGGRELADALRIVYPSLPILFMSGQPDLAPELPGGPNPDTAFIRKPFSPNELASKLRALYAGEPA